MKVLAAVVSWGTAAHLPGVVATLGAQSHRDLDVVVIDNASADDSVAVARRLGVEVLSNAVNRGYAGAANQAVALAGERGCDALLLANPDVRPDPDHIEHLSAALAADAGRASVQGKLWRMGPSGARVLDGTGHIAFTTRLFRNRGEGQLDVGQYGAPGEVFGVSGAFALYRLDALADVAVGGEVFDPDLFAFFEDVDVDWRLRLRGWTAHYEPAATGWHERGGSGVRRSAFVEELNYANRLLTVVKNDATGPLLRALPQAGLVTLLKAGELALTVPSAFLKGNARLARLLPAALRRRRVVQARATVAPEQVVSTWFERFDYAAWVRTWWARVRAERGAS